MINSNKLVTILWLSIVGNVGAQTIVPDRTTLDTLLGGAAMTEPFQSFPVPDGYPASDLADQLNSTTSIYGETGWVIPGFTLGGGILQWNGVGYYAVPPKTVVMSDYTGSATIQFTAPVTAFGVDLYEFEGFGGTATAVVYATDDTTVLTTINGINIPGGASMDFLGVYDPAGIGEVVLSNDNPNYTWSPLLSNLTFGVANVPESSSSVLFVVMALGLVCQRYYRKNLANRRQRMG
jgi:hypothetical protein